MWFGSREDDVRRLEREAYEALEAGEWSEADARAQKLLALGWSGGFEIAALAARGRGDAEAAARALEEGVEKAPAAWPLWHLLAVVRSDLGRYDDALDAFERALACEGSDAIAIRFNRAIAQHRRGDPGAALDDLELILALPKPPPFAEDALALSVECLAAIGRAEDGLAMVRAALDACREGDPRRDRLIAELAVALERARGDAAEVRACFLRAAEAGVATPSLLALGRRLDPRRVSAPRLHRLIVEARAPEDGGRAFLRVFDVVADDREQALSAVRPYLPASARDGACVEEHHDRGPTEDEPGVWWASGRLYYDEE